MQRFPDLPDCVGPRSPGRSLISWETYHSVSQAAIAWETLLWLAFTPPFFPCVQFALMEAVVALAVLIKQYDFTLVPDQKITMTTGATIHTANGLYMNVHRRA